MGFFVGLIVNVVLLSIPIGGTLGTLFAIRPFTGERKPIEVDRNALVAKSFCNEYHEFIQNKNGLNFTINSNEILAETTSTLCMSIKTFENSTYPSNCTVPEFSMTWEYPFHEVNKTNPKNLTKPLIHAFPQASIAEGGIIPITLEDLGLLALDFQWTMGTGDKIVPSTSERRLEARQVNASVALDMYIDGDKTKAADASQAAHEMIIYFANMGLQDPVGFGNGTVVMTRRLNGTDFDLFVGKNDNDQNVFSWVSQETLTEFSTDVSPLFNYILDLKDLKNFKALKVDIPSVNDFIGYVGFGTQAYNSIGPVTFWVPRLSIDIRQFGE